MSRQEWIRKYTSRKYQAMLIGVITPILIALNVPQVQIEHVVAIIGATGSLIAYILGEAYVDAARLRAGGESLQGGTNEDN